MPDFSRLEWILIIGFSVICYCISDGVRRIVSAQWSIRESLERFEEKYLADEDDDVY